MNTTRPSLLCLPVCASLWNQVPHTHTRTATAQHLSALTHKTSTATVLLTEALFSSLVHLFQHLTKPTRASLDQSLHHTADLPALCDAFFTHYPSLSNRDDPTALLLVTSVFHENPALCTEHSTTPPFAAPSWDQNPTLPALLNVLASSAQPADSTTQALPSPQSILDLLRTPARLHPDSLKDQLLYVTQHWGDALPETLHTAITHARDVLREEILHPPHDRQAGQTHHHAPPPPPSQPASYYDGHDDEPESFTHDQSWMPNTVIIAKSTHVWLSQLSTRFQTPIHRLDQIPDQALQDLHQQGFNALWLIGVWQRSQASKTIKQRCGQPDAIASAYAIDAYRIADDLGGPPAFNHLRQQCARHNIRLAGDMVPNHFGLDSTTVVERPDLFLQRDDLPFPSYTFNGPDLCDNPNTSVHLEDGYWNQSDAAVVFRHHNHPSNTTRYIYHGNDGTQMPWNDTAQLDFLNPETRAFVSDLILHVAQSFSIIRFDAAMTLARRHIQRLWYPAPGSAGAIPSRAGHDISPEDFARLLPNEFWREVVDRIAREAPDTLLIAEAFWLMESYFVRTLGMHRVYNSAFMHMLHREDNHGYQRLLHETLAFSPGVLQRFVNFMNNPDEETAIEQFGDGDKAFGVTLLLATLPGLPLFGHGQTEGLREKYGMEYKTPRRNEPIRTDLLERHQRDIAPWMHKRHLFSGVEHFALYPFQHPDAEHPNSHVYAFSNMYGEDRAIVLFNNSPHSHTGTIHTCTPTRRDPDQDPTTQSILEALKLDHEAPARLLSITNAYTHSTLLISCDELQDHGLSFTLSPYQSLVLHPIRVLYQPTHQEKALHHELKRTPHKNLDAAYTALLNREKTAILTRLFHAYHSGENAHDLDTLSAEWTDRHGSPLPIPSTFTPSVGIDATLHSATAFAYALRARTDLPPNLFQNILHNTPNGAQLAPLLTALTPLLDTILHRPTSSTTHTHTDLYTTTQHIRQALGVHTHDGTRWFKAEPALCFVEILRVLDSLDVSADDRMTQWTETFERAVHTSQYDFDALLEWIQTHQQDEDDNAPTLDRKTHKDSAP